MRTKLTGKVVSVINKTATIAIERVREHPIYRKKYHFTNKVVADTGEFKLQSGQIVEIEDRRKLSKTKRFVVTNILGKAIEFKADEEQQ